MKKKTVEEFIDEANKIHNNKYDYSKTVYSSTNINVCIICHEKDENGNEHGEFYQTPKNHLRGHGCPKCKNVAAYTTNSIIEKFKVIHSDKYDYSKVKYKNAYTKVCITCPIHGEFWQKPNDHLQGKGCSKCNGGVKIGTEEFIRRAKGVHGNKYCYDEVDYVNSKTEVKIICPTHGMFLQRPNYHLNGHGCPICGRSQKLTKNDFVNKSKQIHNNKYNYSNVEYINNHTKVCIICPVHGEFLQLPSEHLRGKGCQKCNERKLERDIRLFLEHNNIDYEFQYHYDNDNHLSTLDFYLIKYNIGIECQGEQHFIPIDFAGRGKEWAQQMLTENKERDRLKSLKCKTNDIRLIYYTNKQYEKYFEENGLYNKNNVIFAPEDIIIRLKN